MDTNHNLFKFSQFLDFEKEFGDFKKSRPIHVELFDFHVNWPRFFKVTKFYFKIQKLRKFEQIMIGNSVITKTVHQKICVPLFLRSDSIFC